MIEVVSYRFGEDAQRLTQLLVRDGGRELAVNYAETGDAPQEITVLGLPDTPASIDSLMAKTTAPGPYLNPPVLISSLREEQARTELLAGLLEHTDAPPAP